MSATPDPRCIVLVEGVSDRVALEALAIRRGQDLADAGVAIVVAGGATSFGREVTRWGPAGHGVRLAGLCDRREAGYVRGALERAGLGREITESGMEDLGFWVCDQDLEDELIRALGVARAEAVVHAAGEGPSLRRFRDQPAQRGRPPEQQLRRFLGTRSGRKERYAQLLVDALDLDHIPRPLVGVLSSC